MTGPDIRLTWAALLGRWIEFARSATVLPDDHAGRAMRASVPDVIMLQAVWFALKHLDELDPHERALGLDRAQVLIDTHAAALRNKWAGTPLPPQLLELIDDVKKQFDAAS